MSFEGLSNKIFQKEETFINSFLKEIKRNIKLKSLPHTNKLLKLLNNIKIDNLDDLSGFITDFIMSIDKKVILMIDEVDKSSNNQLFLDFLGVLRSKYLLREQNEDFTFHSVILTSVYDIKNLKLKIRPEDERKFNSPWNIAVDFEVEMDFNPEEIATMLSNYKNETKTDMNIKEISEVLYYYTSGHPYLVSKLCQIIDKSILPEKNNDSWTKKEVEQAVKIILRKKSVNFESLIKNLENNKELYRLVYDIIVEGKEITYNQDNPVINIGELYGIFENKNGILKIHNRIYEQRVYNYMISKIETSKV